MKKLLSVLLVSIVLISFTSSSYPGYISLFEDSSSAKYFKYGNGHYFEYFDNDKEDIEGNQYFVNYRKYSWGDVDTTYIRKGVDNYYHLNKNTLKESILLPISPKLGDQWLEGDQSWSYEVIAVGEMFRAPGRRYKDCIKVHCVQLTNRDSKKNNEYFLYYSPEFGYVGNVDGKGNLLSFLSEIKLNAKDGQKIGGD